MTNRWQVTLSTTNRSVPPTTPLSLQQWLQSATSSSTMAGAGSKPPSGSKAWSSITRRSAVSCASMTSSPRMRRSFTKTTDSDHDQPIFFNLAKTVALYGPTSFGSPISLTSPSWAASFMSPSFWTPGPGSLLAMLSAASSMRVWRSLPVRRDREAAAAAWLHPSFCRGSQYAAKIYRDYLAEHSIKGSMSWRGNPFDNAKAESFMKTLKFEGRLSNGVRDLRRRGPESSQID